MITIHTYRPARPGETFGKAFGLKAHTSRVAVPRDVVFRQLEQCMWKGCVDPMALVQFATPSGLPAHTARHVLDEIEKALGREESQEFADESDEGRDEEEAEARDGSEGDQDETIASGARRRGKRTPKRQRPEAEADEFTSDEHLPGKMGGTTVARSWAQYARDYSRHARNRAVGHELAKSVADLERTIAEVEAGLYE